MDKVHFGFWYPYVEVADRQKSGCTDREMEAGGSELDTPALDLGL